MLLIGFARIGVMRALNRHVERVFDPTRKEHRWSRRKLRAIDNQVRPDALHAQGAPMLRGAGPNRAGLMSPMRLWTERATGRVVSET
jgi:hypothetical protein